MNCARTIPSIAVTALTILLTFGAITKLMAQTQSVPDTSRMVVPEGSAAEVSAGDLGTSIAIESEPAGTGSENPTPIQHRRTSNPQQPAPSGARECPITNVFYDTDLREVLHAMAAQCFVNVIADETVSGIITVELEDVPLEEAMRRVLTPFGLTFRWMGGYYLVGSPRPDNPSFPMLTETQLYRPSFVEAVDVLKLLSTYYDPFLRINKETNTVSLTGSPELIARMKADLAKIDRPPRQIMIEALVIEESSTDNLQLGISWNLEGSNADKDQEISVGAYPSNNVGADSTFGALFQNIGIKSSGWIGEYQARLSALVEEGKVRIRANPRIGTLEGKQARIFVGREEYFSILTGSVTYAYARLEVIKTGISLTITPYVSEDGFITLEVEPEVSDVVGSGSTGLPVTNKRSVSTRVRVADGETVVIGGLRVKNRTAIVRKVPLLGSIPILGHLFRHTDTKLLESEITVLITPHIWQPSAAEFKEN